MSSAKTITISLPINMGQEIEKVAKEEHRTVSELLRETFRQYQSRKRLQSLALEGQALAKKKNLSEDDFNEDH